MCIASTELIKVLTQIYNMQFLYNEHISGFCSILQHQFLGDNQSSGGDPTLCLGDIFIYWRHTEITDWPMHFRLTFIGKLTGSLLNALSNGMVFM